MVTREKQFLTNLISQKMQFRDDIDVTSPVNYRFLNEWALPSRFSQAGSVQMASLIVRCERMHECTFAGAMCALYRKNLTITDRHRVERLLTRTASLISQVSREPPHGMGCC